MKQSDQNDQDGAKSSAADQPPVDKKKAGLSEQALIRIAYSILAVAAVTVAFFLLEKQGSTPPVKDITWQPPTSLPAGWKQAKTDKGVYQYLYEKSTCIVAMERQTDIVAAGITSNMAVVERSAKTLAGTLKESSTNLQLTTPERISFKSTTTDDKGKSGGSVTFEASNIVYQSSNRIARIAAYIKGDHALIAGAVCGTKDFNERYAKEVSPFINQFTVNVKR